MDRRVPTRRSTALARLLSILLHPFVVSPLTVALVTRSARWTLLIAATTLLPITLVLLWNVRRGVWSDYDVSRRDQRSGLYWIAIPLFVAAAFLVPAPPWFQRAMLAFCAVLAVGLAADRWLKTSLHLMFAAFCSTILADLWPWSPAVTVPLATSLAWARWHLGHHTPAELAAGTLLGVGAGLYTVA